MNHISRAQLLPHAALDGIAARLAGRNIARANRCSARYFSGP